MKSILEQILNQADSLACIGCLCVSACISVGGVLLQLYYAKAEKNLAEFLYEKWKKKDGK